MVHLNTRVRAPTTRAWLAAVVGIIVSGEMLRSWYEGEAAPFGLPLAGDALLLWSVVAGIIACLATVFLISLYALPGRLLIDENVGEMVRTRRLLFHSLETRAPLGEWDVSVLYFSRRHQQLGHFKRLQLDTGGLREVLLPGDVGDSRTLVEALDQVGPQLRRYHVQLVTSH